MNVDCCSSDRTSEADAAIVVGTMVGAVVGIVVTTLSSVSSTRRLRVAFVIMGKLTRLIHNRVQNRFVVIIFINERI